MTTSDGLPDAAIGNLFEDSYGYLWVASCGGLSRYDGKTFKNFGLEDGLPYLCNSISLEDSAHNIWGISNKADKPQVIKFSGERFTAYGFEPQDSVTYVFSLYQSDKKIYAATSNGIFKLDKAKWQKVSLVKNPLGKVCRQVIELPDHSQLLNFSHTIILKKPYGNTQTIADASLCNSYNTLLRQGNKVLIAGIDRLFFYDKTGLHIFRDDIINHQLIYGAMADSKNRIWVSTAENGILIFDSSRVFHFNNSNGLPHNLNTGICEDREGNIWLGNFKGLIRLQPSYINHFQNKLVNDVRSMYKAHSSNIYFGHADSGFSVWNGKTIINSTAILRKDEQQKFDGKIITGFAEDEAKRIWITTSSGELFWYKNYRLTDVTSQFGLNAITLSKVIYNLGDSSMYLLSENKVFKIKNNKSIEVIDISQDKRFGTLKSLFIDKQNNLWFGGTKGGVNIYDITHKTFHPVNINLSNTAIEKIITDTTGSIWIATEGKGVFNIKYDDINNTEKMLSLTRLNGLKNDIVRDICLDDSNNLWAVCSNGITRFNLNRKTTDGNLYYQNFGAAEGVTAKSFSDATLLKDNNNNIWLGTNDGVFILEQSKIYSDTTTPKIQIEKAILLNDTSRWDKYTRYFTNYFHLPVNPVLPYNKNSVTIYFNAIAFSKNEEIETAYRLDGLDATWNKSTSSNFATFINLPAGDYTFRVKARRKNFAWSNEVFFNFSIKPPFWETWWFRLFLFLIASAVLIYLINLRISRIRKKALLQHQIQELELKALKAQMNPHFIFNAMNSIQSLIMANEQENAIRYLGKFAKLLRQVLDNSDKQLVPLHQELSSLNLYIELEVLRLHKDFDYTINVANDVSQDEVLVPPLVLQPYVENALWHGLSHKEGERKLRISIDALEDFLLFKITDNGIGRTKAAAIKSKNSEAVSKGMNITYRRLSLISDNSLQPVIVKDLYDDVGNPAGTLVELKIKRNDV